MNNDTFAPIEGETFTALYRSANATYYIQLYLSACKNQYCFFHADFGETRIDKKSEMLLSSSQPISNHYKQFLFSVVQQWKHQFPYYQMNA